MTLLGQSGTGAGKEDRQDRSPTPWIVAAALVVLAAVVLILAGGRRAPSSQPGGAGLAAADPYAASLAVSGLHMSEAANIAGGKVTYLDGTVRNQGTRTVVAATVQVGFRNALDQLTQKETLPLSLIRTREPYVDLQPVSAAPLKPGDSREFRLIFDYVAADWNQAYPEVRIIRVDAR